MKKGILTWIVVMIIAVMITRCAVATETPEEQKEPQPIKIEIPKESTYGTITVYNNGGISYQYIGENIKIINNGRDGSR